MFQKGAKPHPNTPYSMIGDVLRNFNECNLLRTADSPSPCLTQFCTCFITTNLPEGEHSAGCHHLSRPGLKAKRFK